MTLGGVDLIVRKSENKCLLIMEHSDMREGGLVPCTQAVPKRLSMRLMVMSMCSLMGSWVAAACALQCTCTAVLMLNSKHSI